MVEHDFLAIDLGASNGRVSIGRLRDSRLSLQPVHRFEHRMVEHGGSRSWDWPGIMREVREGLWIACEALAGHAIDCVSCDGWAQDFGLLDADGVLFYPPVSYRDSRTEGVPQRISRIVSPLDVRDRVGTTLSAVSTLCQLKAMAEREPEILRKAAMLLHIADLVHYDLCGARSTDWTLATASQLRNIRTGSWDTELLSRLGIPSHFLPPVAPRPGILGRIAPERAPHAKLAGVPVATTAGHDTSAATAAIVPMQAGTLFLSAGTWFMLGCCTGAEPLHTGTSDDSVFVLGLALNKWAVFRGGMGFWLLQECRRLWAADGRDLSYDRLMGEAERSRAASLIDITAPRFFTPENMLAEIADSCRQSGQYVPESPGDYARVIIESLTTAVAGSVSRLRELTGARFSNLYVVGGGSRSVLFCRRLAGRLGLPVLAGDAEATTMGNALLQALGAGALRDEGQLTDVVEASCPYVRYSG